MIETKRIGKLTCNFVNMGSPHICYFLAPIPLDGRRITEYAKCYGYTIVVVHGMDWDNDLTPWPAPGVFPGDERFKGGAKDLLAFLQREMMPEIELALDVAYGVKRTLAGISLSGLFALWAWIHCDVFTNIGSISGSFWYDGFADWLSNMDKPSKSGYAYLSLGDKEGKDTNPRYRTVERDTVRIAETLREAGIRTMYQMTSGTHFAPVYPRLEKMFQGFMELKDNTHYLTTRDKER